MASIAVFIHAYLANENWSSNYKPLANDSFKIIISFLHYTLTVHGLDKLHLETILKVGVYQSKLYHMQLQKNYILYFSVEVISSIVLSSVPRKGNRTHLNMLLFSDVIHSIPLHIPGIQLIHALMIIRISSPPACHVQHSSTAQYSACFATYRTILVMEDSN